MAMKIISVTDIADFKLGNAQNKEKGTGCTVIVCEEGAVGGVDVRGGGPATRETDLLRSENTVNAVNAVVLSGGSAFGLEAASGVMRELAGRKIGFNAGDGIVVPIVCGASLYDLPIGDPKAFPDVLMGAQAVRNAYAGAFANGNQGAGTGATVGKMKGYDRAMKTGLGTFACGDGILEVGAVAAVNAVGDIYNGAGNIVAGLRSEDGKTIYGTIKTLKGMVHDKVKLIDDSTSFINRNEIEEALAAAARQSEGEEPAVETAEPVYEEPAEEIIEEPAEEIIEEPAEEYIPEEPAAEQEVYDEPVEEASEGTYEEPAEEPVAEEEPAEEMFEEPEEEFIPETPSADTYADRFMEYHEVSIPVISQEPEVFEEPEAAYVEETAIEPEDEPAEEAFEEPAEEIFEEPAEVYIPEAPVIVLDDYEEPAEEAVEEPTEEAFEEPFAVPAEEDPAEEAFVEPAEEIIEEPAGEYIPEAPVTEQEVIDEPIEETIEEPAEQFVEEAAEEFVPETAPAEEIIEEPEPLSREEMGYDIVFNTTISCLITNAALTKSQANKLASILHDAYARAIKPVHGTLDGDTVFVLATGKQQVNFDAFAALATDIMQYAIIDGAMSAEGAYGLPAARDMQKTGD